MKAKQKEHIHARKVIFVGFVALSILLLFIHGSKLGVDSSLLSVVEFVTVILIVGITILYPERYTKHTGIAIAILATLMVAFEIVKKTISIEVVLSIVMLICGVGIYILD